MAGLLAVDNLAQLLTLESLAALLTLTALEIVLGIDNIVFIAIVTSGLDPRIQPRARRTGLLAAMTMRIVLLLAISWIMSLTRTLFTVLGHEVSGKDLVLLAGGLFLLAKATLEIHQRIETAGEQPHHSRRPAAFWPAVGQIMALDIIFSLDSVVTAVGMARHLSIMIAAIVAAVLVMLVFAEVVSAFIKRHPTLKMLALAFLLLIGAMLVLEGAGVHVPRGYIYFAMAFSLAVEMLNIRTTRRRANDPPVERAGHSPGASLPAALSRAAEDRRPPSIAEDEP